MVNLSLNTQVFLSEHEGESYTFGEWADMAERYGLSAEEIDDLFSYLDDYH